MAWTVTLNVYSSRSVLLVLVPFQADVRPSVVVVRPSRRRPSVRRPSVRRPSVRPSVVRPSVVRPSVVRPSFSIP